MKAVFDLDGCLADDRRRRPRLPAAPTADVDWDLYHEGLSDDPVVNEEVVRRHDEVGHEIVFITARPQRYSGATSDWIAAHLAPQKWRLLMRPDGDMTPSAELKVALFREEGLKWSEVAAAYDDRGDVLTAYSRAGCRVCHVLSVDGHGSTATILREMADTFEERNAVYSDNYLRVAPAIRALFPGGVPSELVATDRWHLFELLVVKLTRFAVSGLAHSDSIHDAAVYAAMIESDLRRKG